MSGASGRTKIERWGEEHGDNEEEKRGEREIRTGWDSELMMHAVQVI